jgi:formylglycine-generating enzyme required for sulfatase activity
MKPFYFLPLLPLVLLSPASGNAAGSMLRVSCEGNDIGAEVLVNGKFKGECPVDIQIAEGTYKLRVVKTLDDSYERVFEQDLRMGDGTVKKVEAVLTKRLNAAAQELEDQRLEAEREEAAKRAVEKAKRAEEAAKLKEERLRAEAKSRAEFDAELARGTVKAGRTFRDCTDCPEMVVIPAGTFEMGSPDDETGRYTNEGPVHPVNVRGFALGKNEITRGQYAAFINASGYQADDDSCNTFEGNLISEERQGRNWHNPAFRQEDSHPAVCLNWNDANAYANWLSKVTGEPYRLPSEAEWEYAARGNTSTATYWGDTPDQACAYANIGDQTTKAQVFPTLANDNCNDGFAYTAPVASFKPNAFGLYDMIGNVSEWTQDCAHDSYVDAPTDGSVWLEGNCMVRAIRGGSWFNVSSGGGTARGLPWHFRHDAPYQRHRVPRCKDASVNESSYFDFYLITLKQLASEIVVLQPKDHA